jgi:transcriptional regulator with XRE-family HTH domain
MPNDRLRDALLRDGLTPTNVAERLGVDRKTAERWITVGRTPYRAHRHALAALVRESEAYLWPDALEPDRRAEVARSEVVEIWAHRADSPPAVWTRLLDAACEQLDMLVFAGLFLHEHDPKLVRKLTRKARDGVAIRLLLGDPDSVAVACRGDEEKIGDALAYRIRNVLHLYEPLRGVAGLEARLHSTTLYNSVFRFDAEMLVTMHVYGLLGAYAPLMHLRRLGEGDLFSTYAEGFERVWASATPAWP